MTDHDTTTTTAINSTTAAAASLGVLFAHDLSAGPEASPLSRSRLYPASHMTRGMIDSHPHPHHQQRDGHQCLWARCGLWCSTLEQLTIHIRDEHVGSGKVSNNKDPTQQQQFLLTQSCISPRTFVNGLDVLEIESPSLNDTRCITICGHTQASDLLSVPSKVKLYHRQWVAMSFFYLSFRVSRLQQEILPSGFTKHTYQDTFKHQTLQLLGTGLWQGILPFTVVAETYAIPRRRAITWQK